MSYKPNLRESIMVIVGKETKMPSRTTSKELNVAKIENPLMEVSWGKVYEKTPKEYVKVRTSKTGFKLSYVEAGYIIKRLNELFGYLWDFEVIDEKIGKEQIYVKGRLTIHLSPVLKLSKTQYGGSPIKRFKGTGEVISIADDLKAAASDTLKKCASLVGIASDVYWGGDVEEIEDIQPTNEAKSITAGKVGPHTTDIVTPAQIDHIKALYAQKKLNSESMVGLLRSKYGYKAHSEMTREDADKWIAYISKIEDIGHSNGEVATEQIDLNDLPF